MSPQEAEELDTGTETSRRRTILVVEDDQDLREVIAFTLGEEGYDVIEAASAAEAMDKLRALADRAEGKIDLLLSDVRMAGMDGLHLTAMIREAKWPIPIVLMSAFPSADVRAEARKLRAPLLPKPFGMTSLQQIIRVTLPPSKP
jgi:two-component system response regulator HydG